MPLLRVPANATALADLSKYEAYTCLKQGSTKEDPKLDRKDDGDRRAIRARAEALRDEMIAETYL